MKPFSPLLRVRVEHAYFESEPFTEFVLRPTPGTRAALGRAALVWIREEDGYALYRDPAVWGSAAGRPGESAVPGMIALAFDTFWDAFGWVTPLPSVRSGEVRLYSASLDPRGPTAALASGPVATPIRPLIFTVPPEAYAADAAAAGAAVSDGSGRALPVPVVPQGGAWRVDLSGWGPGCYQWNRGEAEPAPLLVEPDLMFDRPIAVLALRGFRELCLAPDSDAGGERILRLSFPTRPTVWRYHVFPGELGGGEYSIRSARASEEPESAMAPVFGQVPGIPGPRGEVSLSFESEAAQPIPMRHRPRDRFQLLRNGTVVMNPLPVPGPTLALSRVEGTVCSEMIVYL